MDDAEGAVEDDADAEAWLWDGAWDAPDADAGEHRDETRPGDRSDSGNDAAQTNAAAATEPRTGDRAESAAHPLWQPADDPVGPGAEDRTSVAGYDPAQQRQAAAVPSERTIHARLALNPNKAGLQSADRERVNQIIYEASKGSRFFKREQQRDAMVSEKVAKMRADLAAFQLQDQGAAARHVDALVQQLEAQRDLTRTIVHVDMDAFYANVEMKDNPALRGKPMAVGGMSMLSTANYEARRPGCVLASKFGVRSAMPGYIGKRLCPDLILVPLHFDRYIAESNIVREVLADGLVASRPRDDSAASLDEAYLDITDALLRRPECSADDLVQEMRAEIFRRTQLTASAGIACNRMLAKISTDINKPNGQYRLAADRSAILAFLRELPIRKIPGVGRVMERLLAELGIATVGQMFEQRVTLHAVFLKASFEFLLQASMGLGSTMIDTTFGELSRPEDLRAKCRELADAVAEDLVEHRLQGKCVTVKLKTVDFEVHTRAVTLKRYTDAADEIFAHAWQRPLLANKVRREGLATPAQIIETELPLRLRLMGLRMTALQSLDDANASGIAKAKQSCARTDHTRNSARLTLAE